MNINEFSKDYSVRKLTSIDVQLIYDLMIKNEYFFTKVPPVPTIESINEDLTSLPKNIPMSNKYYIGYFKDDKLIAIMDLIIDYPFNNEAFIGLFMLDIEHHHKKIGTNIIKDLFAYLKTQGIIDVALGVVRDNEVGYNFWTKMGFFYTGISSNEENYVIMLMRKIL